MKVLALIPHYNHPDTVYQVAAAMKLLGIDCLIVDDGSSESAKQKLRERAQPGIEVIYREQNGGKGAAVKTGCAWAEPRAYTHILQVDADAQHCLEDTSKLLAISQEYPESVVCAEPVYGDDAPKSRRHGRKLTNFWVAINTLSRDIKDGMCGFRIYPLAITIDVFNKYRIGNYMDFDVDLLVRLHREGAKFKWLPTPVSYDKHGVSHFRMWRDNVLISKMHARLFFDMLWHLPQILKQRRQGTK